MKLFFAFILMLPAIGFAETVSNEKTCEVVAKHRVAPKYPIEAARKWLSGWVSFSFTVETDGQVTDISLLDYEGHRGFIKTGRRALSQWRYEITEIAGKKTERCEGMSVRLDFIIESIDGVMRAGRDFKKAYAEIEQLITDEALTEAKVKIVALQEKRRFSKIESVWYAMLQAHYYQASGDIQAQITSLIAATNVSDDGYLNGRQYLDNNNYVIALYDLYMLELAQKQYYRALTTVHYLIKAAQEYDEDWVKRLTESKNKILQLINSDRVIKVPGKLSKGNPWHHKLARSSFSIENIQGRLGDVHLSCESYDKKYPLAAGVIVKIPEEVHFCSVNIDGEDGAFFEIWEQASH
ncbi:energy transducer TonB [Thalassomonas actiniarum]|uniref:Energy transducer TonB n=1 Tax=Thalassomonas actiniarum TaxID=485447 RepID=A0AAE9YQ11_9GAMM|nr:energy transducer TonB [Thalassomonas actiniarum]WDD99095.1 energy transducer TonB [Thalassomonas actiniarum]